MKEGSDQAYLTYIILFYSIVIYLPVVYVLNPSLPLVGWIFFIFMAIWYFLELSVVRGYHNQYRNAKYVEILTVDGRRITCYMTSVGRDHYLVIGKDKKRAVTTSNIIEIYPLVPSEIEAALK